MKEQRDLPQGDIEPRVRVNRSQSAVLRRASNVLLERAKELRMRSQQLLSLPPRRASKA